MLKATPHRHAPWTLVDFNDQRRGRLKLIRHLLDPPDMADHPGARRAHRLSRPWGTSR
jgi:polyphosphate kinase 2 (PPK2 family)